jgi:hypothetical protein
LALSVDSVVAMAPDQSSLEAARKLLKPARWPVRATDGAGLAWGECQGSGSAPYRIAVDIADQGYKCTCPSRKFPCKHTLALLWQLAEKPAVFARLPAPDWVADWVAKRKPKGAPAAKPPMGTPAPKRADGPAPVLVVAAEAEPERDEKSEARAAVQRERVRAAREESVLRGLDELDRWLGDRLEAGLSGFAPIAHEQCRLLARRLNDAKAPGLALILDGLPPSLLALRQEERIGWLIETLGRLQLIAAAYRRQDLLPPPLREDVRRIVGWTVERTRLLEDGAALSATAAWRVVATSSEVQADGLRRLETWLARTGEQPAAEPRFAQLLDFVPATQAASTGFLPGETLTARLLFYPSAAPLRAIIAERLGTVGDAAELPADPTPAAALERYAETLAVSPFIDHWPLGLGEVTIVDTVAGLVVANDDRSLGLPISPAQEDEALPLIGRPMTVAGLWNVWNFRLMAADTGIGPWYQEARR